MLKESETQLYGNEQYEGFGIDLIEEMAVLTGFNYTFILQEDKKNGVKDPVTGKWSGMIGKLIDGVTNNDYISKVSWICFRKRIWQLLILP